VGIECKDGTLIATDSREVYGEDFPLMKDTQDKIEVFGNKFCLTIVGAVGMGAKVLQEIRAEFGKKHVDTLRSFVELCEDASFTVTRRYKERTLLSDEDLDSFLVCASNEGIFSIPPEGISEQSHDYSSWGSSDLYGEYIIKQLYKKSPSMDEAARWAIYAIKQASMMDPAVGGPVHVAYATENGVQTLSKEEVSKLEQQISGESPEFQRDLFQLIDAVVDARRTINQTCLQMHKSALFSQREAEIWALARPVVTEEQFTNRILALGILTDEMTPPGQFESTDKSLDGLERWVTRLGTPKDKVLQIMASLRDIRTLRNKSFPVHPDDAGFVSVVVRWGLSFPPDWGRLYLETIRRYLRSLEQIRNLIDQSSRDANKPIVKPPLAAST
jgi:20S proteasome alpha/beta subunit